MGYFKMNCSIKTVLSKNVFVQTKALFRVSGTICWMTTAYDTSKKLFGGPDRECLAYIQDQKDIGYHHLNRCIEINDRLAKLNLEAK
jgi:hypothetical protein